MGQVKLPSGKFEDAFIKEPSLEGAVEQKREDARREIADNLVRMVLTLYSMFLLVGAVLVGMDKIDFRDLLDLILALGGISGFLSTAINFYFKN